MSPAFLKPLAQLFLLGVLENRAERGEELLGLGGFPSDTPPSASVRLVPRGLPTPLPLPMQAR